ncbi:MAG: protoporphyrinogen oxidase [Candidatus Latescibacterota bacterium]|nr:protoporphyrinogen oxidase [Candidatus Latescibacterota bacterium]
MRARHVQVAIVGAGLSGLAAAHFLRKRGIDVEVVEASAVAGGVISSFRRGEFLFERGPSSVLDNSPDLRTLINDLDLSPRTIEADKTASKSRFIVRDGRLRRLPMSLPAFINSDLFSWGAKLRLLQEPFRRRGHNASEEALSEFVLRRLGREFLDYAVDPFVSGTFAGVPDELSVRAAFPRLYNLEKDHGSLIRGAIGLAWRRKAAARQAGAHEDVAGKVTAGPSGGMLSFDDGMQVFVDALARQLGDQLRLRTSLRSLNRDAEGVRLTCKSGDGEQEELRARAAVLTLPAYAYREFSSSISFPRTLGEIPYAPVAIVFLGFRQNPQPEPMTGFGFLVPSKERRTILGTLWNTSAFPGRAPEGGAVFSTYIGGRRQPERVSLSDEELVASVRSELKELMEITSSPDEVLVQRWERAIPQYLHGHPGILDQVEEVEANNPGIFIGGNFRGGISIGDCVSRAAEMAQCIAAYISAPS